MEGIPTTTITIGTKKDIIKVTIYKWLSQDQEDEFNAILMGEKDVEMDLQQENSIKIGVNMARLKQANKYLVQQMCVDLSWEQFNIMRPDLREELINKLDKYKNNSKKK